MKQKIIVYTDGSSLGNPGQGGRGSIILHEGKKEELSGGEPLTTNNRMELLAVIEVLRYIIEHYGEGNEVDIHLDSRYVQENIEQHLQHRIQRNRRLKSKKHVANRDLRERLVVLLPTQILKRTWVKGHANSVLNNEVDVLAREAAGKQPIIT